MKRKIISVLGMVFIFCMALFFFSCAGQEGYNISVINGSGSGNYYQGDTVTISADIKDGYVFEEWRVNGETFSKENPYSFSPTSDVVVSAFYRADNTANVILLVGGKQATGLATDVELSYEDSETYNEYQNGFNNVFIYYKNYLTGTRLSSSNDSFEKVKLGSGKNASCFGAEMGIADVLSKENGNYYIIKFTNEDGSLFDRYRSASSGGLVGVSYKNLKSTVNEGLDLLTSLGLAPDIRGCVFIQGDEDNDYSTQYYSLLSNFVKDLRKDFGADSSNNIPFIDCAVDNDSSNNFACEAINRSKKTLAENGLTTFVDANDSTSYVNGKYTAVSMAILGETLGKELVNTIKVTKNYTDGFGYNSNTNFILENNYQNSIAKATWNFEYLPNGIKIVAEVEDDSIYSTNGTFWLNDNVEFYIQAGASVTIKSNFSVKVLLSTDGNLTLQWLADGEDVNALMGEDCYYTVSVTDNGYKAACFLSYELLNTDYVSAYGKIHFYPCMVNAINSSSRKWLGLHDKDINVIFNDPMTWYTLLENGTVENGTYAEEIGCVNSFNIQFAYERSGNYAVKGGKIVEQLATVLPNNDLTTVIEVKEGASIFNENIFSIDRNGVSRDLMGYSMLRGEKTGVSGIVTKSGFVIMSVPSEQTNTNYYNLNCALVRDGWECIGLNQLNLAVSTYLDSLNHYYVKWCNEGDVIDYGTYGGYYFVFGDKLDDSSQYYVDEWKRLNSEFITDLAAVNSYGMTYYGIPTLKITDRGRFYLAYIAGDSDPGYQHKIVLSVSDDYGESWITLGSIAGKNAKSYPLDPQLYKDSQNRIWLFFCQEPYLANMSNGHATAYIRIDNPDDDIDKIDLGEFHLTEMNMIVRGVTEVDNNGVHEFIVVGSSYLDSYNSYTYYSGDDGLTWHKSGEIEASSSNQHDEISCVSLSDGTIMAFIRARQGVTKTLVSYSYDYGRSWTVATDSGFKNPNSRVWLYKANDGTILVALNDSTVSREKLTIFASRDDGKTWSSGLLLMAEPTCSYPDIAQAPNGDVYVTFDYNRNVEGYIYLAKTTLDDIIKGGAISSNDIKIISSIQPDKLTRDISGVVVLSDGSKVNNATVKLLSNEDDVVKQCVSNAKGEFKLENVNYGSFSCMEISNGTYTKRISYANYLFFIEKMNDFNLGNVILNDEDYSSLTALGSIGGYQGSSSYEGYVSRTNESLNYKFVSANYKQNDVVTIFLQQSGLNSAFKNEETILLKVYNDKIEIYNYANLTNSLIKTMSLNDAKSFGIDIERSYTGIVLTIDISISFTAISSIYNFINCTVAVDRNSLIPFSINITSLNSAGREQTDGWVAPQLESTDWDMQLVNSDLPYDYAILDTNGNITTLKELLKGSSLTALSSTASARVYGSNKMIAITLKIKKDKVISNNYNWWDGSQSNVYIFFGENRISLSSVNFFLRNTGNFAWKTGTDSGSWSGWRDFSWTRKNLKGFKSYCDISDWNAAGDYVYYYLFIDASIVGLDSIPNNIYISVDGNGTSGTNVAINKIG